MYEVKLSSKNQIVVPREIRNALGVKAGDRLIIVGRGETAVLLRRPRQYSKATAGMASGVYPPDYLKGERESWR